MNGFENSTTAGRPQSATGAGDSGAQLSREEIERYIARAHRLRADELQQWGQRIARTWGSLFRRPGRLIPAGTRGSEPLQPAPQV
jgi:hypothetical protein